MTAPRPAPSARRPRDGIGAHLSAAAAGVAAAGAGTLIHRWEWVDLPAGMALALLVAVTGAVFARAAAGGTGMFVYLVAGFLTTQVMTFLRPGGDVLVTGEAIGYVWLLGFPVATLLAALAPRRWFVGLPEGGAVPPERAPAPEEVR
ncbi:hypothetical protein PU560_10415 [Georgenia sp. 10Sc9-8]|uniref:Uncharacterized protein n=1 Tax=Georgenia halotolerans TaxID=3028317 RepID=A0ABT5U165_9MICO|nr:hypothetical protein [Georgenia halotolerans]